MHLGLSCLNNTAWGRTLLGMSDTITTYRHLAPRPGSAYKQLFVKGTRIRAEVLCGLHTNAEEPFDLEDIAEGYRLPLAAVQEAIDYCGSNPPEIAEDHAREEAIMTATGQLDPSYRYHPHPKQVPPGLLRR